MTRVRADLKMLAVDLADDIATLRRELAEAKAELARLKAIEAPLTKSLEIKSNS